MAYFVIIAIVVLVIAYYVAIAQALEKAKFAYQESLKQLSDAPTSSDLRKRTLHLGRVYSNLTRNNKGVTVFDEMALMNDIGAACGGATVLQGSERQPAPPIAPAQSFQDRLRRLALLREEGLVSDEEFVAKRRQILDEI